jgi:hypothetical protein
LPVIEGANRGSDLKDKVYLLWFVRERPEGDDTELLIGVYSAQ